MPKKLENTNHSVFNLYHTLLTLPKSILRMLWNALNRCVYTLHLRKGVDAPQRGQ